MAKITIEVNLIPCFQCPTCSKSHPLMDENGKDIPAPNMCERCKSPLDIKEAKAFGNDMAEKGHNEAIAIVGRRMRGEVVSAAR